MKKVKLYLNYAGHCWAKENEAIQGGSKNKIKFHALWGLIEHPEKGYILYDTGYTDRFYDTTKRFPNKIYALATKVEITKEEEIITQLANHGISADEIKHVIITHFHADHVAGLKDFVNAKFYCSKTALNYTTKLSNTFAFSKGVLKDLLPDNLIERAVIIEDYSKRIDDQFFGYKYDLFGDASIYIYDLPGHAAGQIGVFLETEKRPYFLIADACWLKKSYTDLTLPSPIVKLFFHSWKDFKQSLNKINSYHTKNKDVIIVPTHCSETTDPLVSKKIDLDVL